MENNWKLVTTKQYYDAEANLAILFCKGQGIDIQVTHTEFPYLVRQGQLPILIVGPKIFQKGQIAKYLINLSLKTENDNFEQLFNIFDSCYQMLSIIDYFMWAVNTNILYEYRDLYNFWNPVNKFQQALYLINQRKKFKKQGWKEVDKQLQRAKIHLAIIQHWVKMQHEKQNPISIYYLFCHAILKSIAFNLRYSSLYGPLIKTELKEILYTMTVKLKENFELQPIEGIKLLVPNFNQQLDKLVQLTANQKQEGSKHRMILQIISLSLFSYVLFKGDFK